MRLWHQFLIPKLPRQQLLGQHRECCALRGRGWGRKHSVVNYVFEHEPECLVAYHYLVMNEMLERGYNPDQTWYDKNYRGTTLGYSEGYCKDTLLQYHLTRGESGETIYQEHNDAYLQECIENLKGKGIEINV